MGKQDLTQGQLHKIKNEVKKQRKKFKGKKVEFCEDLELGFIFGTYDNNVHVLKEEYSEIITDTNVEDNYTEDEPNP